MRALSLIGALSLSVLTGCATQPKYGAAEAEPSGASSTAVSASVSASPTLSATPTLSPSASASPATDRTSIVRKTDWPNVTLVGLDFMDLGKTRFRNGKASSGANNCTMLPGDARPAYAEYLTEEPANSPVTEDALILIECGGDGMDQALIPVQLSFDQKARVAMGFIQADPPTGPDNRMTFTSYAIERGVIVTTVRKASGGEETRRYRFAGGKNWERA